MIIIKKSAFLIGMLLALNGCSSLYFPWVYRIDIPQGNFVTDDMLAKLKPGMSPEEVRAIMGPPALTDPFAQDSWMYLMTFRPGHGKALRQDLTVYFKDGVYDHYTGEVIKDFQQRTQGQNDRELMEKARTQGEDAATKD